MGRHSRQYDELGLPETVPIIPAGERCDRCGFPASFRVGKTLLITTDTSPTEAYADLAVEVKQLDLLFCKGHHVQHAPQLRAKGWVPLQVMS